MTSGKYPHPFTARTVEICGIIDANGPIGVGGLVDRIDGISRQEMSNACLRMLNAGLLTITKGNGSAQSHNLYSTAKDWRALVAERATYEKKKLPRVRAYTRKYAPNMAIPVTEQMIEICEVLEVLGPSTCTTMAENLEGLTHQQVSKCCAYWVGHGLVNYVGMDWRRKIFEVAENWRQVVKEREIGYRLPEPPPTEWRTVNSVFDMAQKFGAMA